MFRAAHSPAAGAGPVFNALSRSAETRPGPAFSNLDRSKKDEVEHGLSKSRKPWRSNTIGTNVEQVPRSPAAASPAAASARGGIKLAVAAEQSFGPTNSQPRNPGRSVAPKTSFKRQVVVEQPFAPPHSQRGPGARTDKRTLSRTFDREEAKMHSISGRPQRDFRRTLTAPAPADGLAPSVCSSAFGSEDEQAEESRFPRQITAPAAPEELDFQAVFSSPEDACALEEEISKDLAEFSKIMGGHMFGSDQRTPNSDTSQSLPFGSSSASNRNSTDSVGFDSLGVDLPRALSKESARPSSVASIECQGANTAAAAAATHMMKRLSAGSDAHRPTPRLSAGSAEVAPLPGSSSLPPGLQTQKSKANSSWNSTWLGGQRGQKKSSMWTSARTSFMVARTLSGATSASTQSASSASGTASVSSEDAAWVSTPRGRLSDSASQAKPPPILASLNQQKPSQEATIASPSDSQNPRQFGTDSDDLQSSRRSAEDLDRELEEVLSGYGEIVPALGSNAEADDGAFSEDILTTLQAPQSSCNAADKALNRLANWSGGALPQEDERGGPQRDRRKSYADAMGSTMSRVRHKLAAVKNQFLMSSVAEDAKEHLARETLASQLNSEPRPSGKKRMGWS